MSWILFLLMHQQNFSLRSNQLHLVKPTEDSRVGQVFLMAYSEYSGVEGRMWFAEASLLLVIHHKEITQLYFQIPGWVKRVRKTPLHANWAHLIWSLLNKINTTPVKPSLVISRSWIVLKIIFQAAKKNTMLWGNPSPPQSSQKGK